MPLDGTSWERLLYLKKDIWPYIFNMVFVRLDPMYGYFYINYQSTKFNDGYPDI